MMLRGLRCARIPRLRHSSFRRPIGHSGEGRNPEGWGEGNVVRGLAPRWGRGGARQNPPCQLAVPSHNAGFSYLGAPAAAGMSHCCENAPTPLRLCLGIPSIFRIVIPAKSLPRTPIRGRNPEGWGEGNVVRSKTSRGEGLVPRWGGGGAWQNPPCQLAVPSHNSGFSYLGAPAAAAMSDCCESMSRTPIQDRLPRLIPSLL